MEKKEKYEQMYEMLVTYERKIHEKNQYRFKVYYYYSVDLPVPSVLDREQ